MVPSVCAVGTGCSYDLLTAGGACFSRSFWWVTSWRLQEREVVYRLRAKVEIFLTQTMGDRAKVRILALRRVYDVAKKALRRYGCEGRSGAVIGLKQARKSCGGVGRKLRSTMPILSSTCEDLKTTYRDDRIYVPGSKIHVRRQRNRYSASGKCSQCSGEVPCYFAPFPLLPWRTALYSSSEGGCMAPSSYPYGRAVCRRGVRGQWHRVVFVSL